MLKAMRIYNYALARDIQMKQKKMSFISRASLIIGYFIFTSLTCLRGFRNKRHTKKTRPAAVHEALCRKYIVNQLIIQDSSITFNILHAEYVSMVRIPEQKLLNV